MDSRGSLLFERFPNEVLKKKIRNAIILCSLLFYISFGFISSYITHLNMFLRVEVIIGTIFITIIIVLSYYFTLNDMNFKIFTKGIELDLKYHSQSYLHGTTRRYIFSLWNEIKSFRPVEQPNISLLLSHSNIQYFVETLDNRNGSIFIEKDRNSDLLKYLEIALGENWMRIYNNKPITIAEIFSKIRSKHPEMTH